MNEGDLLQYLFSGFVTACMGVIGFFTKRVVDDVAELKKEGSECKVNLANLRAEVARDYAREVNVQSSLNRIHERLDKLPAEIVSTLDRRK